MGKISKRKKRVGVSDLLGLDDKDPDDQNFVIFKDLLIGIQKAMIGKNISKNELARRLKVSRQAVYDKFSGRNVSMRWIQRACDAMGIAIVVNIIDAKAA